MAFKLADRVQETTSSGGTGPVAMHGAVAGFQSFAATLSDGDTTYYALLDPVALAWEVGLGTWSASGNALTRTTVLASSIGGGAISLAGNAGTQVWQDMPASMLATLIAARGAISSVTDGVHAVTNASTIDFTSGATVTNLGGGVAGVSVAGGGSGVSLTDGTHTVTNAETIVTSGGTVGGSGTIGTISGFGGGGGGGAYLQLESGTIASKISALPTLANPPLAAGVRCRYHQ